MYPCIVGHEIVGRAVRAGAKVATVKVGIQSAWERTPGRVENAAPV